MEIEKACSLGLFCHSTQLLKRNGYKKCSYPFDWVFSSYDNIIHAIENDFKIFLDKSYYIQISDTKCGHSYYNKNMFWHHNPIKQEDYDYFVRCIERFRILLSSSQKKLFITSIIHGQNNVLDDIVEFNRKLSKFTSNYVLLVIIHYPINDRPYHKITYDDNIHYLEIHTLSESNGFAFNNDADNVYLDNIIKSKYLLREKIL